MALVWVIAVVGVVLVGSFALIGRDIRVIDQAWREFDIGRAEKTGELARLRSALGYDGMIHHYKNFVLRQEPELLPSIREKLGAASETLRQLRTLGVSDREAEAIDTIGQTLGLYRNYINVAERLAAEGVDAAEIDATIRIDDEPALKALDYLTEAAGGRSSASEGPIGKALALELFEMSIGYGGMIHYFKNYILRRDDTYLEAAAACIGDALAALDAYQAHPINQDEVDALGILRALLGGYRTSLARVKTLSGRGLAAGEIDLEVRVDDGPAVDAIGRLNRAIQAQKQARSQAVEISIAEVSGYMMVAMIFATILGICAVLLTYWVTRAWNQNRLALETYAAEVDEAKSVVENALFSKNRFFTAANHDVRQPAQAIELLTSILSDTVTGGKASETVAKLAGAGAALNKTLNGLLEISELDAGAVNPKITDFRVGDAFEAMEAQFGPVAEARGLTLDVFPSDAMVRSDRVLIERILQKLVSNAVWHTTEGGVILRGSRQDGVLRIEVSDTGPGIAQEEIAFIFEEYYQIRNPSRDRGKGPGLGLSIADRLAKALGTRIDFTTGLGEGSTFAIDVELAN